MPIFRGHLTTISVAHIDGRTPRVFMAEVCALSVLLSGSMKAQSVGGACSQQRDTLK